MNDFEEHTMTQPCKHIDSVVLRRSHNKLKQNDNENRLTDFTIFNSSGISSTLFSLMK